MILYTPLPPQLTVEHTPERMARLDRRFARLDAWPADPTLLVQDSARVLGAHLTVHTRGRAWHGDPLAPATGPALTEAQWAVALGLDATPTVPMGTAHLHALRGWASGVVTVFARGAGAAPRVTRVLNLGTFLDRVELDFLLDGGLTGVDVLRAHRAEVGGHLTLWRGQLTEGARPPHASGGRAEGEEARTEDPVGFRTAAARSATPHGQDATTDAGVNL